MIEADRRAQLCQVFRIKKSLDFVYVWIWGKGREGRGLGWPLGFQSEQTAMLIAESGINIEKKASLGRRRSLISLLRDMPEYIQGPKIVSQHSLNETKERVLRRATLVWGRGWRNWKRRGLQTWGGIFFSGTVWQSWGNRSVPKALKPPGTVEIAGKVCWVSEGSK